MNSKCSQSKIEMYNLTCSAYVQCAIMLHVIEKSIVRLGRESNFSAKILTFTLLTALLCFTIIVLLKRMKRNLYANHMALRSFRF